jgi:hypothetical protein
MHACVLAGLCLLIRKISLPLVVATSLGPCIHYMWINFSLLRACTKDAASAATLLPTLLKGYPASDGAYLPFGPHFPLGHSAKMSFYSGILYAKFNFPFAGCPCWYSQPQQPLATSLTTIFLSRTRATKNVSRENSSLEESRRARFSWGH